MAYRNFTDEHGQRWEVFDAAFPAAQARLAKHYPAWLCFDSATEKRRLSPIPDGWEHASTEQLQNLLALAEPVKLRNS
jgi:hypothetical protein